MQEEQVVVGQSAGDAGDSVQDGMPVGDEVSWTPGSDDRREDDGAGTGNHRDDIEPIDDQVEPIDDPVEPIDDPRVAAAIERLADLEGLPVAEQVEIFADIHARLNEALGTDSGGETSTASA